MTTAAALQYLDIQIQDDLKYDIRIADAHLDSGQFYREGDRSDIMSSDDIDDMAIRHNGGMRNVYSCGELGSMSGPQGTIDLIQDVSDERICTLAWSASMEPGSPNIFLTRNHNPKYKVEVGNWNEAGTMGEVPVTVMDAM
ncbi:aegerolysin type hemolysin [Aspergillus avenaceus]|uniref:Aegerolysin type hemolysin n=1 Tax=Aspergillus avenaceus TaxID=36643 RepID=A0A5N6TQX4_ASPAV|nr:aegerolysin type hemolysin [Aspergillus avenaceus]